MRKDLATYYIDFLVNKKVTDFVEKRKIDPLVKPAVIKGSQLVTMSEAEIKDFEDKMSQFKAGQKTYNALSEQEQEKVNPEKILQRDNMTLSNVYNHHYNNAFNFLLNIPDDYNEALEMLAASSDRTKHYKAAQATLKIILTEAKATNEFLNIKDHFNHQIRNIGRLAKSDNALRKIAQKRTNLAQFA